MWVSRATRDETRDATKGDQVTPLHPVSRYCTALKAVRSSASYAGPPSHPDTKVRCAVMMIRPCKPRDSAPPALLEFVNSIGPCLALRDYTVTTQPLFV